MYDDGDKEELNLKELREVLDEVVGLSKENAITTPKKNTPKERTLLVGKAQKVKTVHPLQRHRGRLR